MAEQEQKAAIPWLPLITLILVGSGVWASLQQLTSSRPGGGNIRLAVDVFEDQAVDARLWQDPLGVAVADSENPQKDGAAHGVTQFQKLLIHKCFPAVEKGSVSEQEQKLKQFASSCRF